MSDSELSDLPESAVAPDMDIQEDGSDREHVPAEVGLSSSAVLPKPMPAPPPLHPNLKPVLYYFYIKVSPFHLFPADWKGTRTG